jgi:regulator of protease activity HflC (stomatin/prohibitin superfamily)
MRKTGLIGGIMLGVLLLFSLIAAVVCMEIIPAGYVGVVYSMNGGVQDELLTQGFHIVSPTKKVKLFTIGNEQLILTKDEREGSKGDDSFMVSTADNANISVSFQMSYRFRQDKIVDTYKRFRGMSGEDIVNSRVRTVLKAKISEITTFYTMMDIYSGDRGKINTEITDFLNEKLGEEYGIEVIDASIIDVHPDEQLQQTIDDRVKAMQRKQQAEAEQETIKVQNETKILEAEAAAKAKLIEAEAEANANRTISASLTDELLRQMEMEARLQHGWVTVQGASTAVVN